MHKNTVSDKNDVAYESDATVLKKEQLAQAAGLYQSQTKTADALEAYNDKKAQEFLKSDKDIHETPEESRRYAAATLAGTQVKAVAMLKDSQSRAAKALDASQVQAAAALHTNHIEAKEKHDKKN